MKPARYDDSEHETIYDWDAETRQIERDFAGVQRKTPVEYYEQPTRREGEKKKKQGS